jgi:hypothetical protein
MDENEDMKKELRDLEEEIEEMQDNFRYHIWIIIFLFRKNWVLWSLLHCSEVKYIFLSRHKSFSIPFSYESLCDCHFRDLFLNSISIFPRVSHVYFMSSSMYYSACFLIPSFYNWSWSYFYHSYNKYHICSLYASFILSHNTSFTSETQTRRCCGNLCLFPRKIYQHGCDAVRLLPHLGAV